MNQPQELAETDLDSLIQARAAAIVYEKIMQMRRRAYKKMGPPHYAYGEDQEPSL